MKPERYNFFTYESMQEFEFTSQGPNGKVKTLVRFNLRNTNGISYLGLSFGDWNARKRRIDDLVVTNNSDSRKVLATVVEIVLIFSRLFPDMTIYAKGSTPSRTRLYQMGILAHYQEIQPIFDIYGFSNNEWRVFMKGINYEAFAMRRK